MLINGIYQSNKDTTLWMSIRNLMWHELPNPKAKIKGSRRTII
jgi:hypothetical protein